MVESRSIVSGALRSSGPAPAAHNRDSSSRLTASSCRTLDHLCARSQLPTVDGARVASNNELLAPARSTATTSMLSMLSPPASIDPTTDSALVPLLAPCLASFNRPVDQPRQIKALGQQRRREQSGVRHQIALIESRGDTAQVMGCSHPSDALSDWLMYSVARDIIPGQRAFDLSATPSQHLPQRWIRAK